MYKCISLFCGGGGAECGFAGDFDILMSTDIWDIACQTIEQNFIHPALCLPIEHIAPEDLPYADVIIGGPPCQTFSNARTKAWDSERSAAGLQNLFEMKRLVLAKQPKMFICENVATLTDEKMMHAFMHFKVWQGYKVHYFLLNTEDFCIPQKRKRLFFVGVHKDLKYAFYDPKEKHGCHWSKCWGGWADYLSMSVLYTMRKRTTGKEIVAGDEAMYTLLASEQPILLPARAPAGRTAHELRVAGFNPRRMTASQAARMQGFPTNYRFAGTQKDMYKMAGNAWSVSVAKALAKECVSCLNVNS